MSHMSDDMTHSLILRTDRIGPSKVKIIEKNNVAQASAVPLSVSRVALGREIDED